MTELYIAPEGAMQFEITHTETVYKGEHFWVMPLDGFRAQVNLDASWPKTCKCERGFLAILETISPRLKVVMYSPRQAAVCGCVGRIIE